MKILTATILIFLANQAYNQDSVQIITYYSDTYDTKVREIYWVMNSDSSIKVGPYTAYFESGKTWISGCYNNGERIGIWVFNDLHTWEPYLKYDYDNNEEIYYHKKYLEEGPEYVSYGKDTIIKLDRMTYCPAFLPDSFEGLKNYIENEIKAKNITDLIDHECKICLQIYITDSGKVTTEIFRNSCNDLVGKEIVNIVNASPKWTPGEYNGKKVGNRIMLPVNLLKNTP